MNLNNFVPEEYKKSVIDINYKKLKLDGIDCILFDLDNTLIDANQNILPVEIENKLYELKKDFKLIIVSNNFSTRIKAICDIIDIEFVSFSMKPLTCKLNSKIRKYKFSKRKVCIIGDQLMTDILVGKRLGIKTILVDPVSQNDLKITKINRFLEKIIFQKLKKQNLLERGIYYE